MSTHDQWTRRRFLQTTAYSAAALGLAACGGGGSTAGTTGTKLSGTLRIIQWSHFVPAYDLWFDHTWIKQWGQKNGVHVVVDHINNTDIPARAAAEVAAQSGHDLFGFLSPPATYEDQVIDHSDIVQEIEGKVGKMKDVAYKSTFNPKTKKYFGVSDNYVPDPVDYRKDLFDQVGGSVDTWDDLLTAAPKLKAMGHPIGIGMSNELDSNMALIALLQCFEAYIQDENANVTINSKGTIDALKYMKSLYKAGETSEIFSWDPSSNNRFLDSGKGSLILNAISAIRTPEKNDPTLAEKLYPAPIPKATTRMGLEHVMGVYVIWKFAKNQAAAKKFVVDLILNYKDAFTNSKFYNFPSFPGTVSNLDSQLQSDSTAKPSNKYVVLGDIAKNFTTNVGHPGFSNAAVAETFNKFLIPQMFAQVARGSMSAEDAAKAAEQSIKTIFEKWKGQGKI
jgi:multiple sugar transport system substrate-binding protein